MESRDFLACAKFCVFRYMWKPVCNGDRAQDFSLPDKENKILLVPSLIPQNLCRSFSSFSPFSSNTLFTIETMTYSQFTCFNICEYASTFLLARCPLSCQCYKILHKTTGERKQDKQRHLAFDQLIFYSFFWTFNKFNTPI